MRPVFVPSCCSAEQKKMKRQIVLLVLFLSLAATVDVQAQCSVCRRAVESSSETGQNTARGLNKGILYLMAIPYLMGGIAGVIWWKNKKS